MLSMNLAKLILRKSDHLIVISLVYSGNKKVIWTEKVTMQEFEREVMCAIEKFILEIKRCNSDLVDSDMIKKLIELKAIYYESLKGSNIT